MTTAYLSQRRKDARKILAVLASWREIPAVLLLVAAVRAPALAQCAMCYQTAAASGPQGRRAMNLGIILLLLPVVSIIGCIVRVAYKQKDS